MHKDMNELREVLRSHAETIAVQFGVKLDYTDRSVTDVECILGEVHDEYRRTRNEGGLRGVALEFAAYLVSIVERHHGSIEWKRDDPTVGEGSFPLHWNGTVLFPYGWCLKRIFDGPADDIVSKWRVFVLKEASRAAAR